MLVPSPALVGIKGPEGRKFLSSEKRPGSDESVMTLRLLLPL